MWRDRKCEEWRLVPCAVREDLGKEIQKGCSDRKLAFKEQIPVRKWMRRVRDEEEHGLRTKVWEIDRLAADTRHVDLLEDHRWIKRLTYIDDCITSRIRPDQAFMWPRKNFPYFFAVSFLPTSFCFTQSQTPRNTHFQASTPSVSRSLHLSLMIMMGFLAVSNAC